MRVECSLDVHHHLVFLQSLLVKQTASAPYSTIVDETVYTAITEHELLAI